MAPSGIMFSRPTWSSRISCLAARSVDSTVMPSWRRRSKVGRALCATSGISASLACDRGFQQREEVALVAHLRDFLRGHGVAVRPGDRLVARNARVEQAREHPASEVVGLDLRDELEALFLEIDRQVLGKEGGTEVQRLGVGLRAFDQRVLLLARGGLDVEDQRVLGQELDHAGLVELAQAAAD